MTRPLIPPSHGWLSLVCSKCRKEGKFAGDNRTEAAKKAKDQGWTMPEEGRFNCPRCSRVFGVKGAA